MERVEILVVLHDLYIFEGTFYMFPNHDVLEKGDLEIIGIEQLNKVVFSRLHFSGSELQKWIRYTQHFIIPFLFYFYHRTKKQTSVFYTGIMEKVKSPSPSLSLLKCKERSDKTTCRLFPSVMFLGKKRKGQDCWLL